MPSDRSVRDSFSSATVTGFSLRSYCIGVEVRVGRNECVYEITGSEIGSSKSAFDCTGSLENFEGGFPSREINSTERNWPVSHASEIDRVLGVGGSEVHVFTFLWNDTASDRGGSFWVGRSEYCTACPCTSHSLELLALVSVFQRTLLDDEAVTWDGVVLLRRDVTGLQATICRERRD